MTAAKVREALRDLASDEKADSASRFFKTGPGQYGEGDRFIGVTVPEQRRVARVFRYIDLDQIAKLLSSRTHEDRLTALLILVSQHEAAEPLAGREMYRFYCDHLNRVNNWDLVDSSAPQIAGPHANGRQLQRWARSANLWHRRVAMLTTFHEIRLGNPQPALSVALLLMHDDHDLIHKAMGWMLREIGTRCGREVETGFLKAHHHEMPRTALRYAIEKFPSPLREQYLRGAVPL